MIEFFFGQYSNYPAEEIYLEITAVFFGIISVLLAKKDNVLVFPTGIISTSIYVYLLWKWSLIGDMMINGYYFLMSIYGWYHWTRKKGEVIEFPISKISPYEKKWGLNIFIGTIFLVIVVYIYFGKFTHWTSYVDTFTTGVFFVGMWLMARRKIENWILWIIGDLVSIPLYFYKGYTFTSIQYVLFTIIAYYGWREWKRILENDLLNK